MRCSRVSRPALLALLALVAAASLLLAAVAYTIVLKDGSTLQAKEKYTVKNGRAIIILLNGAQTFVPVDQIDVPKTEQANKLGLGTGVLVPGSPQDVGTVPAQPRKDEASKPMPLSNVSSLNAPMGMVRWCQAPGRSVKRRSTNFTCSSTAYCMTRLGSINRSFVRRAGLVCQQACVSKR